MHINPILQHFRKLSGLGRALSGTLLSAAMLFQPFNSAWAVDRLSTGQSWFVLNETGIDTLGVQRLRITGTDADAFAIEGYTGSPAGMVPSQDVFTPSLVQKTPSTPLGVNLRFTPQHSGDHQASLEVTHDGSNASPASYPLKGTGAWDVTAQASTNTIDFGEQAIGMPAMTQDAFVRAVGAHGWLKVTGVKLEGSTDFTLAQVGLANKGTSSWGAGVNLEVLPAGATASTKLFTAADVSAGGLTDAAVRVRYTPTSRGAQTAVLTVYHDGPGHQKTFGLSAEGLRSVKAELTGVSPFTNVAPIKDFERIGLGSAAQYKNVYLKASGTSGYVTYFGFKFEGSADFVVTRVAKAGAVGGQCVDTWEPHFFNPISYENTSSGGARQDTFSVEGMSVDKGDCFANDGKHFALTIQYQPRTLGKQTASLTIFHDGNDQGYSTFDISGEAFRDVRIEATGTSPFAGVTPIKNFTRAKVGAAAQLKNVYLKASGTFGEVTYTGFTVEGSTDFVVTRVAKAGAVGGQCGEGWEPYLFNPISYMDEPSGGARQDTFSIKGMPVTNWDCFANDGKHFALTVRYQPNIPGQQHATITIYHDGNAQGFTTFDISGEAY